MNAYDSILQRACGQHIPLCAHMELTYRCNLRCMHCYADCRDKAGEMNLSEITRVLDQLAAAGALFLNLTGGEIALRPDLVDIIAAARARGFAVRLLTNGTLFDDDLVDRIAIHDPMSVEISLYAAHPDLHDRITGVPGSFEKSVAALRRCREHGLNIAVKTMLLRHNLDAFDALERLAIELGARFAFDYMLVPSDSGASRMAEHGLTDKDLDRFFDRRAKPTSESLIAPDPAAPLCGAGCATVAVNPFGEVFPCLAIRESVGNLCMESFSNIWHSARLDKLRKSRYSDLEQCMNCAVSAYCIRCPGTALAECGSLLGCSETACRVAHAAERAATRMATRKAGLEGT